MKQNPCRYCVLSKINRNGKHYPGYVLECRNCENLINHKKYLEKHRKFDVGEPIKSLELLLEQEWVMWGNRTTHIEAVKSLQLRIILRGLENNGFRKAIRKESEE